MTDSLLLGEQVLSLLDQSVRTSTYKPALLLAIVDRAPEYVDQELIPVSSLAERVVEFYWPQTLGYPTTGLVLLQNQTKNRNSGQAAIVNAILEFREKSGIDSRPMPEKAGASPHWVKLQTKVERILAEYPIPRLQRPFDDFLYTFDWPADKTGGWKVREFESSSKAIRLNPGVAESLTALGPLLRPFITRWWTEKAARLNQEVEDASSLIQFEDFMFGRDRVALERLGEGLLDLQRGKCFYCGRRVAKDREIDHFIPWSHSGDDGLNNLVAACRTCNNSKRATLAGPEHVSELVGRNIEWSGDLSGLASERRWPCDRQRTARITSATYLHSPDERPLWLRDGDQYRYESLGQFRSELQEILIQPSESAS